MLFRRASSFTVFTMWCILRVLFVFFVFTTWVYLAYWTGLTVANWALNRFDLSFQSSFILFLAVSSAIAAGPAYFWVRRG